MGESFEVGITESLDGRQILSIVPRRKTFFFGDMLALVLGYIGRPKGKNDTVRK